MMVNGFKHYVTYSKNECINSKKKAVYLRRSDIYIDKIGHLGHSETSETLNVPDVPNNSYILKTFVKNPNQILAHVPRQFFSHKF